MKKRILIVLMLLLSIVLIACGDKTNGNDNGNGNGDAEDKYSESLKVLAIGNSFSDDAVDNLWKIASDYGIEDVVIGMLYIGGTSLQQHHHNATNNLPVYTYYRYNDIHRTSEIDKTIEYGILAEDWDIITLQQVSQDSGLYHTYSPYLQELIDFVLERATNEDVELAFHMTWAYQASSTHSGFHNYDRDQIKMYNAIVDAGKNVLKEYEDIDFILPSGTAIQNGRGVFGDTLTRDGYHLDHIYGRYIASMQWFKTITGFDLSKIRYRTAGMTVEQREDIKEIVEKTTQNPFEITILQQ